MVYLFKKKEIVMLFCWLVGIVATGYQYTYINQHYLVPIQKVNN